MNSITEAMLGHVLRCRSSAEIWTTFVTMFATQSKARILHAKGLLQSTKKGALSIDEYILRMKQFADILTEAGDPISDESLALYILNGVGPEYEASIVNLTNRSESFSLADLQFSLQSQELRLLQNTSSSVDQAQANFANLSLRGSNPNRGAPRGSRGSQRSGRSYSGGRSSNRGSRPVCQLCNSVGHTVHRCYHRFDIHFTAPSSIQDNSNSNESRSPQANLLESCPPD